MKKILLASILAVCVLASSYAQTGALDQSFGEKGIVRTDMGSPGNFKFDSQQVLYQADGSYYFIWGTAPQVGLDGQVVISKHHADGSVDVSYGRNGFSVSLVMAGPHAVMQPDGKIIVAGTTININVGFFGVAAPFKYEITRFNTDGSLDNSFNGSGILLSGFSFANVVKGIALQSDSKIVVVGVGIGSNASSQVIQTSRYNADGTLDETFGNAGNVKYGVYANANCVTIQSDGKILVGGGAVLLRYNQDGTPDNSLNGNGQEPIGGVAEIAVQSDGKMVLRLDAGFSLARINANGGLDNSFDGDGMVTTDFGGTNDLAKSLVIQTDGKIILVGATATDVSSSFAMARYNANGSPDNSFSGDGKQVVAVGSYSYANASVLQADGKLFALGINREGVNTAIASARFNATDGSPDVTYNTTGQLIHKFNQGNTSYTATAIQPDGKILAAGYSWNGLNMDFALVRYNADGSFDNSFSGDGKLLTDFGGTDDRAAAIAIQADGKVILAGVSGGKFAVARYTINGTPDISFDADGLQTTAFSSNDSVSSVAIQPDGKIIVAGTGIVRYNANGSLDLSFDTDGKLATPFNCNDLILQGDNKILVTGKTVNSFIARYNTNGTADIGFGIAGIWTFNHASPYPSLNLKSLTLQNDGKILASGFDEHIQKAGTNVNFALTRIDATGADDIMFNGGKVVYGLNGAYGTAVTIQSDNKIVVGGYYLNGNNEDFALSRFNTDGSIDNTFGNAGNVITAASMGNDRIAKLAISGTSLFAVGFGQFPGNFGVVAKYALGPQGGPLPVVLTDFTASLQNNNTVLLQWQTASEQNLAGFSIERSTTTNDFTAIGYVSAKGNTNSKTDYVTIDKQPSQGINFYRLKMIDYNGKFVYSKIVSVEVKNELFSVRLSPNPAKNTLYVKLNGLTETATLQISDANGIKVKEAIVGKGNGISVSFDVTTLPSGIYNVRLQTASRSAVLRFVKD